MKCKLCLEEKELIKKSHILPNFIYNGLFDGKHRLVSLNINDFNDKSYHQTGYYEGGILCADCDNGILGGLERYASNTIYAEEPKNGVHREYHSRQGDILPVLRFRNLNYTKLKLFFLSPLWKSHISKLDFFSEIDLGSKYGEKIRKMILGHNAGKEDEFEVVLVKIETDGTRPSKSIVAPRKIKVDGHTSYMFHINEITYHFNISLKQPLFEKGLIKFDGILDIGVISGEFARSYFDNYIGKTILMRNNIVR